MRMLRGFVLLPKDRAAELTQPRRRLGQHLYDSSEEHVHVRSSNIRIFSVLTLGLAGVLAGFGQTQTPAPVRTPSTTTTQAHRAPAATATVRGTIADPTGALIPGAKVDLTGPEWLCCGYNNFRYLRHLFIR